MTEPDLQDRASRQNSRSSDFQGCWRVAGIGCLSVVVLAVIGGFFFYRGIMGFISGMSDEYTFPIPMQMPTVSMTDSEAAAVLEEVAQFSDALDHHQAVPPLVLTAREINILINRHPDWKELSGKVYVSIDGDRIKGLASIPLDSLGGMFEGRYLNGSVVFRIGLAAGRLLVFADSLEIGGKALPDAFVSAVRARNLADDVYEDPESMDVIDQLQSIAVRDGTLIIEPRRTAGAGAL